MNASAINILKEARERVLRSVTYYEQEAELMSNNASESRAAAQEKRQEAKDLLIAINDLSVSG